MSNQLDAPPKDNVAVVAKRARKSVFYMVLSAVGLMFVAPLVWMISTSFKTQNEAVTSTSLIPDSLTFENYAPLLQWEGKAPVLRWFFNSVLTSSLTTVLVVITAALAGYALAWFTFRGRSLVFSLVIGTLFLPGFIFLVPNYLIINELGLLDSLLALILPSVGGAFGVFFMRQFFSGLPRELDEAAKLDGAGDFRIFASIMLPLAQAGLSTLAVLTFLASWNDFLWPVYVLYTNSKLTLPAGLPLLQSTYIANQPLIMAGAVLASVPALIVFILVQRKIIESVAASGIKG
ncbi:carbohydrate ABC transporter permease [Jonesiaceae bacterium BS-20]|uniref:Carbohydrate ABC transporter permease n=1 Tax=Jonesiaceae bacterium BS-20 TaxID=3120821 RepID=A0AAU7DU19_9MICO